MGLKTHNPLIVTLTLLPWSPQAIFVHVRIQVKIKKKTTIIQVEFFNTNEYSLVVAQITFEGISGSSITGDIAVDDVSLMDGICKGKNHFFDSSNKNKKALQV